MNSYQNLCRFTRTRIAVGLLRIAPLVFAAPAMAAADLETVRQLAQSGKPQAALEMLEPLRKADPDNADAHFLHGILLTELNRPSDAIQVFKALAKARPELPEPHNNLAVLYASQARFDEARKSLEDAIRTNPSYAIAQENLGDLYARLASMAYDQALQIDQANNKANATVATKLQLLREIFLPVVRTPATKPAAAAPAAGKPSKKAEVAKRGATDTAPQEAITTLLNHWAAAWGRKEADAYLAFYDADFVPAKGVSRSDWEALRRERIAKPTSIEVSFDQLKIHLDTPDKARVKFRQHYRADHLKAQDYKVMELILRDSQWKIVREQ